MSPIRLFTTNHIVAVGVCLAVLSCMMPSLAAQTEQTPMQIVQTFFDLIQKGERLKAVTLITNDSKEKTCQLLFSRLLQDNREPYLRLIGLQNMNEYYQLSQDQVFARLLRFILDVKFMKGWETNCVFRALDYSITETDARVVYRVESSPSGGVQEKTSDTLTCQLIKEAGIWKIVWKDMPRF